MSRLVWLKSFESGVPLIDSEHKALTAAVNRIASVMADEDFAECRNLTREFLDESEHHFAHEETLLEKTGFPRLPQHAARHKELLGRIRTVTEKCPACPKNGESSKCLDELVGILLSDILEGGLTSKSHLEESGLTKK